MCHAVVGYVVSPLAAVVVTVFVASERIWPPPILALYGERLRRHHRGCLYGVRLRHREGWLCCARLLLDHHMRLC